ncbi:hypothetical protein [Streptomyces lavenduligriseus]|uniref:CHAT domain-containing protein n=1 Tax=Streptomyces lavenduligriseus TaxID=67315 RepID=A0ABT0P4U9_9ACTN|nr:hypothetical protein [Streptomyces lavenduligriseus]MCL3998757.1 hypothetical protein [Streptomyces lavenduligriseus]
MKHISRRGAPSRTPAAVPAARRPARRRTRVVRNLRVLVVAPERSPRCQADARRTAARLTYLPRVTPLPSRREPLLVVAPGQADRALGTDADVLYLCTHSYPEPAPIGFLDTDLADLHGVLTARALILDTCWGAASTVRRALAALRPADLPPLALLAPAGRAPFDHHVLAGPVLETLLTGDRTGPWHQRLAAAKTAALASPELAAHARRDWARWQIHSVPGTRTVWHKQ